MFGVIGTVIFGIVAVGAWISEETREHNSKSNAKNIGSKYYFDKNGRMRWVNGKRKFTPEEIHNIFWDEENVNKRNDYYEKKYWVVKDLLNGGINDCTIEVFLTEKEAVEYKNNLLLKIDNICSANPENYNCIMLDIKKKYINVGTFTQYRIDIINNDIQNKHNFHYNF